MWYNDGGNRFVETEYMLLNSRDGRCSGSKYGGDARYGMLDDVVVIDGKRDGKREDERCSDSEYDGDGRHSGC